MVHNADLDFYERRTEKGLRNISFGYRIVTFGNLFMLLTISDSWLKKEHDYSSAICLDFPGF